MLGTIKTTSIAECKRDYTDILQHITNLNADDRYMRFGYPITDQQISKYVESSVVDSTSTWLIVRSSTAVVATLHIAISVNVAEFGLTVEEKYRGTGIGKSLFSSAYHICRNKKIKSIRLNCLRQNKAMQNIAKHFGLVVSNHGSDSDAVIHID